MRKTINYAWYKSFTYYTIPCNTFFQPFFERNYHKKFKNRFERQTSVSIWKRWGCIPSPFNVVGIPNKNMEITEIPVFSAGAIWISIANSVGYSESDCENYPGAMPQWWLVRKTDRIVEQKGIAARLVQASQSEGDCQGGHPLTGSGNVATAKNTSFPHRTAAG